MPAIRSFLRRSFLRNVLGATAFLLMAGAASAQTPYPNHPIRLVVGFAPGGPTDIIARILAASMSKSLGQNVVVDNRAGAGGNIGMALVVGANPDRHTLLLTSTAIAVPNN